MFSRIFTLLLLLVALKATAQRGDAQRDLIITQAGEQIRCRIVDESSMRFTYTFINEKGKQVKTEIFKTLISSFKYNYFPDSFVSEKKTDNTREGKGTEVAKAGKTGRPQNEGKEPAAETLPRQVAADRKDKASQEKSAPGASEPVVAENRRPVAKESNHMAVPEKEAFEKEYVSPLKGKTEFTNYLKYRVGFKGGLGNIIDENTDKSPFGIFNEKLRRGWVYGVDAAVFLNDHFGLGVTYQSYQSRNKNVSLNSEVPLESGGSLPIASLESKVNHKFVGPTFLGRVGMDYKTFIVATVSPGYYFYSDKGIVNQMNYEYKGGAWGGAATLGIDFLIGNNETGRDVILSFECGYNYGKLNGLKPENGWNKLPIGLNRLDFAVGLRFTRFPRYLR